MRLETKLEGSDRVARHIQAAIHATGDLEPVWNQLEDRLNNIWLEQFESEGGLTGGWPPLQEETLKRKRATRGQRTTIMQRSGSLMRGLVNPFNRSDGAVSRMAEESYERGTSLPYAATHQDPPEGSPVPQREFLVWRREDADWLVDKVGEHIAGHFE